MLKVLAFLLSMSPGLLAAVTGSGGALLGAGGVWALHAFVIDPNIRAFERARAADACTIKTLDAANRAEAAERARQDARNSAALKAYQDEVSAREARRVQELEAMEDDLAGYRKELADQGRTCPLDLSDVERVRR
jgi:hypothetical protein